MCVSQEQNFQNKMFQFHMYDKLINSTYKQDKTNHHFIINKWPKVTNLFAQRLQWHHQPYHYCTHVIILILYDIICIITYPGKCKCRHRIYIFFVVEILYKSIANIRFNQLTVFVVKIRVMDRYITEIIVLVNKIYVHMA